LRLTICRLFSPLFRNRLQAFVHHRLHGSGFLRDEGDLRFERGLLVLEAGDHALVLALAGREHADLLSEGILAGCKSLFFDFYRLIHLGVALTRDKLGRERDFHVAVALGLEACFLRRQCIRLVLQQFEIDPRLRIVEDKERLPGLHLLAVMDQNFLHDPTFEMLDRLAMRFHHDDPRRLQCAVERREGSPAEEPHDEQHRDCRACRDDAVRAQERQRRVGDFRLLTFGIERMHDTAHAAQGAPEERAAHRRIAHLSRPDSPAFACGAADIGTMLTGPAGRAAGRAAAV